MESPTNNVVTERKREREREGERDREKRHVNRSVDWY
jgi:hypothetical protein